MYPVAANFHALSIQDSPQTRIRIYFIGDNVDCTDDNDVQTNGTLLVGAAGDTDSNGRIAQDGVSFNEFYNPDKDLTIGTAVSSQIGMTLLNTDGALNGFAFGRCKVYLDVYDPPAANWLPCPMGVYNIELPTKRKVQLVSVSGYDQMQKFEQIADTWWNGLNWSAGLTLLQIVQSMAAQVGVSVSNNTASAIVNSGLTYTEAPFDCIEVTYREVLELIAEATGTVARFDRDGALDIKWFGAAQIGGSTVEINTDLIGNQCFAIDLGEYQVGQITQLKVKIAADDVGVTVGSGTNQYVIVNNLFLNGADAAAITAKATPIYNRLNGLAAYTPVSGRFIFDWSIEAGDIINITRDGTTYAMPIFQQTMTWRGGFVVSDLVNSGDQTRPVLSYDERSYYRLNSEMSQKVGDNEIISKINQSPEQITIQANKLSLLGYTTINDGFKVNLDGTFEANGATINGSLESNGTDASIKVDNGSIAAIDASNNEVAVIGVGDAGGVVWTTAPGYGSVELDGDTLFVEDENGQTRITASSTAASGGQFTVKDSNWDDVLDVRGGKVNVNGGLSTNNNSDIDIDRNVNITSGALDVAGGGTFGGSITIGNVLDVTSGGTFGGSVTIGNALYLTNRRASASSVASAGWYRVLEFSPSTVSYRLGRAGIIIDLDITRFGTANETHHISLSLIESNARFYGEESNSNTQLIDKVRYTYDGSKGYVDIHLSASWGANVAVDYQVSGSAESFFGQITTESLAAVDDSPSGETVLAEYAFGANGTYVNNLNGFLNLEQTTIANGNTGSITIPSSSSAYLLMTGVNAKCFILCAARANSSGAIVHGENIIGSGTIGATFSTSTNTLSITNRSGNELQILILRF